MSTFLSILVDRCPESYGVASRCGEELKEDVYYDRIITGVAQASRI